MIGAHPDDCEVAAGGFAALHLRRGNQVKFISTTNGCRGHQSMSEAELAARRGRETANVSETFGVEYDVWDVGDGELVPSLGLRRKMVSEIRRYSPDLILTHRPCDYHPDHRATSALVRDASYLLIVPNFCSGTEALKGTPVTAYFYDNFLNPPFKPDIMIKIDEYVEEKFRMIACHKSQVYEWLPYTVGKLNEVPLSDDEKFKWLKLPKYDEDIIKEDLKRKMNYLNGECKLGMCAVKYRDRLKEVYGKSGETIRYAEAFEIGEYGGSCDKDTVKRLFPL